VEQRDRVLELVGPHCDLAERLRAVPPWAEVRGVYFRAALDELERRGLRGRFEEVFPDTRRTTFTLYPLSDYLPWIALAGALVTSPAEVHAGMHALLRDNSRYFGQSLLGRGLLRLISHDPLKQMSQAVQSKRAVTNYGKWTVTRAEPGLIEVDHEDEYVWIESALAGGALGGLEACGVHPTVEPLLRDAYNGTLRFRW
jgi:uncharacterized protein (TIGR02265 family)